MATNLRALVCATLGFVVLAVACGGDSSKATPAPTATQATVPSLQTPLPPSEDLDNKVVPQLAGLGKIAFWKPNSGIWVMNSDGSDRRRLVDIRQVSTSDESPWVSDLRWAPDGQRLSFSASGRTEEGGIQDVVRVIDLEGRQQLEIPQATAASWSPDGGSLAFVAEMSHGPMEVEGVPSVMNLATAETRAIGDQGWFSEGPRWSPNGSVLAWADTSAIHLAASDGSWHRLVLEAGAEGYGWAVNWSPMGNMLSFFEKRDGDVIGFIVYDVLAGRVLTAIQPYPSGQDPHRCQKHASNETFQTDWMPDGKALIFHGECGYTGENGVWIVDIATGERRLIPAESASYVDVASDGKHLVFQALGNSIWVADVDGSPPILLAEGWMPVWQPQPR